MIWKNPRDIIRLKRLSNAQKLISEWDVTIIWRHEMKWICVRYGIRGIEPRSKSRLSCTCPGKSKLVLAQHHPYQYAQQPLKISGNRLVITERPTQHIPFLIDKSPASSWYEDSTPVEFWRCAAKTILKILQWNKQLFKPWASRVFDSERAPHLPVEVKHLLMLLHSQSKTTIMLIPKTPRHDSKFKQWPVPGCWFGNQLQRL